MRPSTSGLLIHEGLGTLLVPGEKRRECHREDLAPLAARNQPRQRRKPQPVGWLATNLADLTAQDTVLVAHGLPTRARSVPAASIAARRPDALPGPGERPQVIGGLLDAVGAEVADESDAWLPFAQVEQ